MRFSLVLLAAIGICEAFAPLSAPRTPATTALNAELSRRNLLSFGLATVVASTLPVAANAASNVPTQAELDRIKEGYNGLVYLLDNFEQETTICRENGGECKRDADPVRKYLGLRSTTDPLFQIEKVFNKVKNMDIDPDKLDSFFEATEDYNSAMTLSTFGLFSVMCECCYVIVLIYMLYDVFSHTTGNSMAFISQFGEYNPGGGKDEVLKYLNESKKQVVVAKNSLKTIMDALDISA